MVLLCNDWVARLLAKLNGLDRWSSRPGDLGQDDRAHPELRVYCDERDTGDRVVAGERPYWLIGLRTARRFHLHVENRGPSIAVASSGTLETFESLDPCGNWHRQPGFNPLPLRWAGRGSATVVNLHPGIPHKLDIARVYEGSPNLQLVSPASPTGSQREYPAGTYRMTVSVTTERNGRARAEGSFVLDFGGDWNNVRICRG